MPTTRSIKQTRDELAERRAAAAQRARDQIDMLRTASALRRQEAAVEAMAQLLTRGRLFFTTLADLFAPQVWATNAQGGVLDHLLMVDDATYASVLGADAYDVWSLADVLAQPWEDLDAQAAWVAVYVARLDEERDAVERRLEAARRRRRLTEIVSRREPPPKGGGT